MTVPDTVMTLLILYAVGHHIYSTTVYTRLMCNALYTTDDEISTSNHALLVVSCS